MAERRGSVHLGPTWARIRNSANRKAGAGRQARRRAVLATGPKTRPTRFRSAVVRSVSCSAAAFFGAAIKPRSHVAARTGRPAAVSPAHARRIPASFLPRSLARPLPRPRSACRWPCPSGPARPEVTDRGTRRRGRQGHGRHRRARRGRASGAQDRRPEIDVFNVPWRQGDGHGRMPEPGRRAEPAAPTRPPSP